MSETSGTHVRTLPGPGIPLFCPARGRAGKAEGAEACNVRDRGVRSGRSSVKGCEQGESCGVTGAKAPTQGEAGRIYHTPYTEIDLCVQWNQAATAAMQSLHEYDPRDEQDAFTRTSGSRLRNKVQHTPMREA
ncbi:MAG: hypothetical protein F4X29_03305 [Rhodothermaceae bacterium]|nr:hypothetical protein [Rhodothermaceae bacterium]